MVVTVLLFRTFLIQGLFFPIRIAGDSMATSLLGRHLQINCDQCNFTFFCGIGWIGQNQQGTCPNCGSEDNPLRTAQVRKGKRVFIQRTAFFHRNPHRWEIVALKNPSSGNQLQVKRIVGLSGEQISIRHGDIYANGMIVRKSLEQLKSLAILVYDDRFPGRPNESSTRFTPHGRWHRDDLGYLVNSRLNRHSTRSSEPEILSYRHFECTPDAIHDQQGSHITDYYGFNSLLSTRRHYVTDILLELQIQFLQTGILKINLHDGMVPWQISIDTGRQSVSAFSSDQLVSTAPCKLSLQTTLLVDVATCDQRLLVAIDGKTILALPYNPDPTQFTPVTQPIGFLADDHLKARLSQLRIFRDIYYLDPHGANQNWQAAQALEQDEYFLLGDNAPISQDSRATDWRVRRRHLLGRVF